MPQRYRRQPTEYTLHNSATIVRGGADYFERIDQIADGARYTLHLQTYIFDEDETGKRVAAALMRAAQRGVAVYVLLDGYASQKLSAAFINSLRSAGVHFSYFSPFLQSSFFYIGRRLHHKLIVADGSAAMAAGINVSNRYNDIGDRQAWLDWALYVEGEAAKGIADVCVHVWNRSRKRPQCPQAIAVGAPGMPASTYPVCPVRIRRNDWVFYKTEISATYRELFRTAESHVTIMTSYFWPPQRLLRAMARASARGVKIKLILTGKADVPLAKYAERYLYKWLFRHNIEVYEYQRNILHGKSAVSDNKWLTIGSYNVNNISAFASVELNLDVKDNKLATELNNKFETIIAADCVQINKDTFWESSGLSSKVFYYLAYRIIHMVFFLFTFYFTRRRSVD